LVALGDSPLVELELHLDEQVVSQEEFKDCSNASDVILQVGREDQDVIDVHMSLNTSLTNAWNTDGELAKPKAIAKYS
jgi:hypothetical protein